MNIDCYKRLSAILFPLAATNSQLPCLMFEFANCQGRTYPPTGSLNQLGAFLTKDDIGLPQVGSIYIPPHMVVQFWSPQRAQYYQIMGPTTITDLEAQVTAWGYRQGQPCVRGEGACFQKVRFSFGDEQSQLESVSFQASDWNTTLATYAAKKLPLKLGEVTLPFDYDTFFKNYCTDPSQEECGCHDAYQELLKNHPQSAAESYINLVPNNCNPNTQYVPTGAKVGEGTTSECLEMIRAQVRDGSLAATEFTCNNVVYQTEDLTPTAAETVPTSTETQITVWVIVGVLLAALAMILIRVGFLSRRTLPVRNADSWMREPISRAI